jgi:hypothetical protein
MGLGLPPGAANDTIQIDVTATGSVSGFILGVEE